MSEESAAISELKGKIETLIFAIGEIKTKIDSTYDDGLVKRQYVRDELQKVTAAISEVKSACSK